MQSRKVGLADFTKEIISAMVRSGMFGLEKTGTYLQKKESSLENVSPHSLFLPLKRE